MKKHRKEENDLSQGREAVGDKANGVLVVTKKGHGFVNKGYRRESEPVNYIVATKSEFTTIPLEDRTTNEEKDCQSKNQFLDGITHPAGNYMFKVNNKNTRTRCEICSKLTIKTPELASFWCLYC